LSDAAAAARSLRDGSNVVPVRRARPLWREAVGQVTQFFALMLWIAGLLAFVAKLPQLGVAIFVVVLANGAFAFAQEHRAQRAAERLRDLLPRRTTVTVLDAISRSPPPSWWSTISSSWRPAIACPPTCDWSV
jgi:magnesium-transporting ATPase (P-type)